MVYKRWNLDVQQLEREAGSAVVQVLHSLCKDGIITDEQYERASYYAPRVVMGESLLDWLKKKIFDKPDDPDVGRWAVLDLYDYKIEKEKDKK